MFEIDRIFSQRNSKTGLMEWFFSAREGVLGPFENKAQAQNALKVFADFNIKNNDDGGRSSTGNIQMTLTPLIENGIRKR
jgi:hypothetical protein